MTDLRTPTRRPWMESEPESLASAALATAFYVGLVLLVVIGMGLLGPRA